MENVKVITRRKNGSIRVTSKFDGKSKTDPSWAKDLEAQNVINKYMKTGVWTGTPKGSYDPEGRLMNVDLSSALTVVREATDVFNSLPSELRARFGNSPEAYVSFIQDKNNMDEAIKLGLLVKKENIPTDTDRVVESINALSKTLAPKKSKSEE